MKRRVVMFFALSVLLVDADRASAASILYSQASNFPGGNVSASQNDLTPGGFGAFATVHDDFTLAVDATISDVHWQGGYFNPATAGAITEFTIRFSADASGQPDGSLLSQTVAGVAGETFVGTDGFGTLVFSYSVILPTSFSATAGTRYWLSIVSTMTFPPQWGWYSDTAASGNNLAYLDFFGTRSQLPNDFAFDLTGDPANPIPEPMSLTLFATGLAAAGIRRYRRKR